MGMLRVKLHISFITYLCYNEVYEEYYNRVSWVSVLCYLFTIARSLTPSCVDSNDVNISGNYDPDGDGGLTSFPVECEGNDVVLHHNREAHTEVDDYDPLEKGETDVNNQYRMACEIVELCGYLALTVFI